MVRHSAHSCTVLATDVPDIARDWGWAEMNPTPGIFPALWWIRGRHSVEDSYVRLRKFLLSGFDK